MGALGRLGNGHEGDERYPRIIDFPPHENNPPWEIIGLDSGDAHSVVLSTHGAYSFGFGGSGALGHGSLDNEILPRLIQSENTISLICCGAYHTAMLTESGSLLVCGDAESVGPMVQTESPVTGEECVLVPTLVDCYDETFSDVACGPYSVLALSNNKKVSYCHYYLEYFEN